MADQNFSRISFQDEISRNKRNSFFLTVIIFAVFILLGWIISLAVGMDYFFLIMIFAIIFSLIYILISYYNSDKIAISSVKAKKVAREGRYKQYHDIVEGLTLATGMPKPDLYVMPSQQINAFASGRNPDKAVLCVTEGALDRLDKRELEGVLAHEMGHVVNYDIRYMTLVTIMVGMIAIISEVFLRSLFWSSLSGGRKKNEGSIIFVVIGVALAILAPVVVYFVQMAISRKREYASDSTAVKITRYPPGLTNALKKIRDENKYVQVEEEKQGKKVPKAMASLFFSSPMRNLTSTHPPIEKRIEKLERM